MQCANVNEEAFNTFTNIQIVFIYIFILYLLKFSVISDIFIVYVFVCSPQRGGSWVTMASDICYDPSSC